MNTDTKSIRDIMIPLSGCPCLKPGSSVQDAIRQLRSFCPLGSSDPCGFNELMVVDDEGGLVGRVSQQGILKVLFSTLLEPVDIKNFDGKTVEYSDLSTLLGEVLIREGINHLNARITSVIERGIRTLPASANLIHAMSVMVICQETVLPVIEQGKLCGIIQLAEIFGAIGDQLIAMNSKQS